MAVNIDPIDYDDEREVRLRLGRLIEPEDQLFAELLELVDPAQLLRAVAEGGNLEPPIPEGLAAKLESRRAGLRFRLALADPAMDLEAGERAGARYLIPGDEGWPTPLDDMGGRAPIGLWMIGGFPSDAPVVAMVGARACTGYGLQAAGQLASELAKDGVTIVSGAALGVDGAAHRGTLAVGGVTVAVLACGVDRRYPASHDGLIQAIGERGAVLAELPPGTAPTRFRFLARNRLIAGLAAATVVVEAAGRSGSLVTARLAAELGRAVFAVPGPITSRLSMGTNALLCDGAIPALDGRQVQSELGIEPRKPPATPSPPRQPAPTASQSAELGPPSAASTLAPPRVMVDVSADEPAPPRRDVRLDPAALLVREALPTVRSGRAVDAVALAAETGLTPGIVLAALGLLAACGVAVKTGGGWALMRPESH
jgi:DNA processing protein